MTDGRPIPDSPVWAGAAQAAIRRPRGLLGRRSFVGVICASALVLSDSRARADVPVPVPLQAQLASKVSGFDRNFPSRAGPVARVLVLDKAGDDASADVGAHFASALNAVHSVAGLPVQIDVIEHTTGAALAERCRAEHVALVYLSTGLDAELQSIASALVGVDVLTIGVNGSYASRGAVIGFDLEDGKPKLVLNLARAKAQNVSFRSELLKLSRLVSDGGP